MDRHEIILYIWRIFKHFSVSWGTCTSSVASSVCLSVMAALETENKLHPACSPLLLQTLESRDAILEELSLKYERTHAQSTNDLLRPCRTCRIIFAPPVYLKVFFFFSAHQLEQKTWSDECIV